MVVFFDDDEDSHTYAEQMERCPGCELWLYALAIRPNDVAPRAGGERNCGELTGGR
jgi:hypothetical protein